MCRKKSPKIGNKEELFELPPRNLGRMRFSLFHEAGVRSRESSMQGACKAVLLN